MKEEGKKERKKKKKAAGGWGHTMVAEHSLASTL